MCVCVCVGCVSVDCVKLRWTLHEWNERSDASVGCECRCVTAVNGVSKASVSCT